VARLDRLNAAVGARRSRLLGPAGLRALALHPGAESRLGALRAGPWGDGLPASDRPSLEALEAGLRESQRREAARLLRWAEGRSARAALQAFFRLAESDATTSLLRGLSAGASPGQIVAAAPPASPAFEAWLREAATLGSIEALLERLRSDGHPLAGPLGEAAALRPRLGLWPLEAAVTRVAVSAARQAAGRRGEDARVLAEHLSDRADLGNAALLLTLAGSGPQPELGLLAIPGGRRLPSEAVAALAGAPLDAVARGLSAAFGIAPGLASPWELELALEGALARQARREARARPFSIAVPIAYLLDRRSEARRIAVLLRGSAVELPPDELLGLLEA
jgi:V/A-type H+-transporting ATPase subunit C